MPIKLTDGPGRPLPGGVGPLDPALGPIRVEADHYRVALNTEGYVSGVAGGSFVDRKTGARDLGYGLCIADFLLEPDEPRGPIDKNQYDYGPGNPNHGAIAKRYVEGPQICTQAGRLAPRVGVNEDFAVVRFQYRWNVGYGKSKKVGSMWEQTLIFPAGSRYFLAADRVTTVAESPALFMRMDMPGHIKHRDGMGFDHVYLSYDDPPTIPSTEFAADFPPEAHHLYRRGVDPRPERLIRGYQVDLGPGREPGPWLAGMTLNVDDVYQAWCHQRGYVCMIQEFGGRPTRPGDTFGACHLVGWFDDTDQMAAAFDRHRGCSGLALDGPDDRPTGYRLLKAGELTAGSM